MLDQACVGYVRLKDYTTIFPNIFDKPGQDLMALDRLGQLIFNLFGQKFFNPKFVWT